MYLPQRDENLSWWWWWVN